MSVVVAAYEAAETLGGAVRSALSAPDVVQCLVVDDASPDGTGAVADALAAEDPRVTVVVRAARGGPAAARDDGLVRATGARVCFLDADDELVEGGLAALGDALDAAPEAVAALGRFRAVDAAGGDADVGAWADAQLAPVVRRGGHLVASPDGLSAEALVTRLVSPPPGAWLVDAATLRALGGFDPSVRRSEDLEALVRLASAGPIVAVEREVLHYRRHATQRSAAHARRRWGRGLALWAMLRAAPGAAATRSLARGIAAYHLELARARGRAPGLALRAMGLRNLVVAVLAAVAGLVAAALPRALPAPLALRAAAVD